MNELSGNLRNNTITFPDEYNIPEELQYDYMLHMIIKTYGISIAEAEKFNEADFAKMVYFENIESARAEYLRNLYRNERTACEH